MDRPRLGVAASVACRASTYRWRDSARVEPDVTADRFRRTGLRSAEASDCTRGMAGSEAARERRGLAPFLWRSITGIAYATPHELSVVAWLAKPASEAIDFIQLVVVLNPREIPNRVCNSGEVLRSIL